ncbi:hypothetical protein [Paenibacillus wynnii]|uniref:Uncharacterized protein n=1 Tax=Paenibacillus wynnii TaxID=268407 RepID=A0A098M8H2_9BACL|nr:hypothetical protein [Paenibacillus wynnii]KGE18361.1 hypothetical protein PWYN_28025 [Paenibacillus wynnii]
MAFLSTGPIENNVSMVTGVRPTQQITIKVDNRSSGNAASALIEGYHLNGTRTLYVSEFLNLAPNQVVTRNYYANLDAFEFTFTTSGMAEEEVQISFWGKDSSGQLVTAHRLVSSELLGEKE